MPQKAYYWTGEPYIKRAVLWYLTPPQISQAWESIKSREKVLLKQIEEKETDPEVEMMISDMREGYYRDAWKAFNNLKHKAKEEIKALLTYIRYKEEVTTM